MNRVVVCARTVLIGKECRSGTEELVDEAQLGTA